ncbi:MAG TPA: metallophosphoesterase [Mycobacteriales bacterium]|nr:metallophosphoesterase [Mycobacteriales bacterium]
MTVRAGVSAVGAFAARWILRLGLPLAGMAALLALFPYHLTAAGTRFSVQGSLLSRPGLSADTTFGSWTFPHLDWLPFGVHVAPVNLDLVRLASTASPHPARFANQLRGDLHHQLPYITAWLIGELLIGFLLGMAAGAIINLAVRQLRRLPYADHELRHRGRQLLAGAIVAVLLVQIGVATYNPGWPRRSRVSGTIAALQLFPRQLQRYYQKHSKPISVLNAVSAIQANLQQRITKDNVPPTAFNMLLVSDMHLASTYPIVTDYAKSFHVQLILNTGDEAEFGTSVEMTPTYLRQLRGLTSVAPMIWLAGNHDSPSTVQIMRRVPGVTVLGTKIADGTGGSIVAGQQMSADGLQIAAVPDPRIYGGTGDFGSNDAGVVHDLEDRTVDSALAGVPTDESFDIFATHEPVAADRAVSDLAGRIRQVDAGHLHVQNPDSSLQQGSLIKLIEGSTGAGGLDNLNADVPPPPVEFTIESVAADCQFTKVVRFQIRGTAPTSARAVTRNSPPQVTASTVYFKPQTLAPGRSCSTAYGLSVPSPLSGP